jgi:WD40 repeat protein
MKQSERRDRSLRQAPQPSDLQPGTGVGPYLIERLLGRGGMSTVYLAEDVRLHRMVALKVLSSDLGSDPAFRERFLRESRLAASLDHPNVVPVYDAGSSDGALYIAMRYVEGTDLRGLMEEEGALDPGRALPILSQVAEALDVAHDRGLVHRDVKPSNVLLAGQGDRLHAYLGDFGLVKRASSGTALTATGQFMGTIDYTSPEQVLAGPLDGRADQYSLAATGYQVLTGSVPFPREYEMATLWAHVQEPPPRLSSRRPDLPPSADGVLARGMAKSPEDRYGSCSEFVRALADALEGAGTLSTDAEAPTRHDVVLTHARVDAAAAARVADKLRVAGLAPWVSGSPGTQGLDGALSTSSAVLVFVGPEGAGDWDRENLRAVRERSEGDGPRLIPVLLPGLPEPFDPRSLPPFLATEAWVDLRRGIDDPRGFQALVNAIKGAPLSIEGGTQLRPDQPPYRGLRPFEESDAELFFGREAETQRLVEEVKGSRFLAVLGPSGSGKSSLVKAGLVPALRSGAIPGSGQWVIRILKPGQLPLLSVVSELLHLNPEDETESLHERLISDPASLHVASALALGQDPETRLVWVVDQFEEAFTLCSDEAEREAFLANLLHASYVPGGRAIVVLTMRADFYPRLAAHPELAQAVSAHDFLVAPMDERSLRRAVEEPAKLAGLAFEEGLVGTILSDAGSEPGSLPLLEHALYELWERRRGAFLTLEAYLDAGRVRGALAKRAEAVYEGLDEGQQAICRRIMLRLTQPGEGTEDTRRRATASELATAPEENERVEWVLGALVDARLLTVSADPESGERWVDVSHEALIRAWPRLKEWIEEDRAGLILHRRVTEAASDWDRAGRDDSALYRGVRLAEAEAWAAQRPQELNPLEREFVEESRVASGREAEHLRRTNRRLRGLLVGVALFLVLALVAGSLALIQRSTATRQRNLARSQSLIAEARGLAAQATALVRTRLDLSLLLAVQGLRTDDSLQSRAGLLTALNGARYLVGFRDELGKDLAIIAMSGDGASVATARKDGLITVWNAETSATAGHFGPINGIYSLSLSKDGGRVAASGKDGVHVWDTRSGESIGEPIAPSGPHNIGTYLGTLSPDGRLLLVQDFSQRVLTVGLWRPEDHARVAVFHLKQESGPFGGGAFTPDGRTVVLAGGGFADSFSAETGEPAIPATRLEGRSSSSGPAVSPTGDYIAVSSTSPVRISLLNAITLKPVGPPLTVATGGRLYALSFSLDGRRLAAETDDGAVTIFDVPDGTLSATLTGRLGLGTGIGWLTPDRLASSTSDGVIEWDLTRSSQLGNLVESGKGFFSDVAFLADGRLAFSHHDLLTIRSGSEEQSVELKPGCGRISTSHSGALVAVSCDPGVEIVDVEAGRVVKTFPVDGFLWSAVFSPDDRYLALSVDGSLSVVKVANGETVMPPTKLDDFILLAVAWTADGRTLMTGGQEGDLIFIDTKTWKPVDRVTLEPQSIALTDFELDPDQRRMYAASESGVVWVVDVRRRRIDGSPLAASGTQLEGVALSPDGKLVAAISRDGAIRLWESDTRRAVGPALSGYAFDASGVAWGNRGLYTAGTTNIDFAKNEGRVGLLEWNFDPRRLTELACGFVQRNLTRAEWSDFVGDGGYRITCPMFPPGE